jgi:hypothetical protein
MLSSGNAANAHIELPRRIIGSLFMPEHWWRDRYDEIAELGYELRPRYKPNWQPSWLKSGKDFFKVEDGQPTLVRVAKIILLFLAHVGDSCVRQWTRPACEITFKSC